MQSNFARRFAFVCSLSPEKVKLKIPKKKKKFKKSWLETPKSPKERRNPALVVAEEERFVGCQSRRLRESESGEPPAIAFARENRISPPRCRKRKFWRLIADSFLVGVVGDLTRGE